MTDVQKCDGCGAIRFMHNSSYSFSSKVSDVEASPDAVDITSDGHLCDDCARKVAELIESLGEQQGGSEE